MLLLHERLGGQVNNTMADERPPIGELLRRRREELRQSDEQAAVDLGVGQSSFNRWRLGRIVPKDDMVPALAKWLDLDEDAVTLAISAARRNRSNDPDPTVLDELLDEVRQLRSEVAELRERDDRPH